MACRLPGGVTRPPSTGSCCTTGASGVVRVPANRWDADAYFAEDHTRPGKICNREGGFLTSWQPDEFDAEFFGISPREAIAMDPQQRLLLEVAWEALENAGITPKSIRNTQTGDLRRLDHLRLLVDRGARAARGHRPVHRRSATRPTSPPAGCRISLVCTARRWCSTPHARRRWSRSTLACQSLRRRESDQALAAGVNLILTPAQQHRLLAVGNAGPGRPVQDVRRRRQRIRPQRRLRRRGAQTAQRCSARRRFGAGAGSRLGRQPGRPSSGQTVPSGPAQQAVLRAALASARLEPSEIDYIEAHGTGTALGDPIELDALSAVFGEREESAPLVLGSVKTNLGHLENSAGIAGFIKTVLSLSHGYIPPHLHFTALTPNAGAGASKFTIAADGMAWPAVNRPRRAGVSSFGVSGTNAHIVIEQAPVPEAVAAQPEPAVSTLVVSGKTPARIAPIAAMLAEWMDGDGAACRWPISPTPSTTIADGTEASPPSARVTGRTPSRVCGRWPRASPRQASSSLGRSRTVRARCFCIRVRVRSGLGWVGSCWSMSRRLRRRWPSWSRILLRRLVFRCVMCWLPVSRWWVSSVSSRCWWVCSWR